jgi:hypothetical protein
MSKYNNGGCIPFNEIRNNRFEAVKEISEGNKGLQKLLNTCISLNYPTIASCGDEEPYILFELNQKTSMPLFYLCRKFLSQEKYFNSIRVTISSCDGVLRCDFHLKDNNEGINFENFFEIIDSFLRSYNEKKSFDYDEFLYSCNLCKLLNRVGLDGSIEFKEQKEKSTDETVFNQYKVAITNGSGSPVRCSVERKFKGLIFDNDANCDELINLKYYKISDFKALVDIINNASKEINVQKSLLDGIKEIEEYYTINEMPYYVWNNYYNLFFETYSALSTEEKDELKGLLLKSKVFIHDEDKEVFMKNRETLKNTKEEAFDKNGYLRPNFN